MKLSEVQEGGKVKIVRVRGRGAIRQRLVDMGLVKGAELVVVRYAPLNDPIQVLLKGYNLALRVSEGDMIDVEPLPGCGCGPRRRRWGFGFNGERA